MIPVVSRRNRRNNTGKVGSKYYWLYDQFTTDRAAGAVNGTLAEPVGGARTVRDTSNKISISSGKINFASGATNFDGIWWPSRTRVLGRTLIGTLNHANTTSTTRFGWDSDTGVSNVSDAIVLGSPATITASIIGSLVPAVGIYSATTDYQIALVMRTSGMFYFIKGGAFTNWTQLYNTLLGTNSGLPAMNMATATTATADDIRVPRQLYVPVPLASDGMSAVTTDGQGNPENNGITGASYTAIGTWGVAGGVRSCSALDGGLGLNYLSTTSEDVLLEAVCTRSAGVTGVVARYADAQNYLIAYHNGTNVRLDKVEGGTTTNLVNAAATYSATAVLRLVLEGTTARVFYSNAAVGAVATVPSSTAKNHGLYTTDTGATFDNLVVWARNTGYSFLDTV